VIKKSEAISICFTIYKNQFFQN